MAHHRSDFGAAITGFIVGGCILFVLMFGMVKWTSYTFEKKHAQPTANH